MAIESGDTALWGAMKQLPYDTGDGTTSPLLDRLPYQMQTKLADIARQAQQSSMTDAKMGYLDTLAKVDAAMATGQPIDVASTKALLDQGVNNKWITAGAYHASLQSMYIAVDKQKGGAAIIQNYQTSVVGDADLAGKTKKEVRDAWVSQLYRSGKSDDQVIDALIVNGTKVGNVESLELVGASVKPIMQKLSSADAAPLNEVENARLSKVLTTLNELTVQNKQGAVAAMLSGMPEEQRVFMETVRTKVAGGILNDTAIREAGSQLRAASTMSAKDRAALYENQSKDDSTKVQDLVKGGFTSWLGTKFTLGAQGDLRSQLVTQRSTGVMATAMLEEMRSLGVANPGTTADVRFNVAMANVSQRLVPTGDYQMLMPKGVSVQQFFGVDATQSNERVGQALQGIAKKIPEFKDKALYFTPGVDGRVQIDAWSKDRGEEGAAMFQSFTVEASQVKEELKGMDANLAEKSKRIFGDGKTFTQGAASVTFNGMSSTTVDPNAMYRFRSNLVKSEGVRDTVYKDSQGNPTAGVGVANEFMPKPGPDGKISQQDINLSFAKASDAAANAAVKIQNQTGLRGDKWFMLVGELAYQSGPGFAALPQYQGMLSAIRTGDVATATAALQKTPAYRMSGPERKTHYERLLSTAMNN
jgi:GH24 family phage-related lysozyme (muramidase)